MITSQSSSRNTSSSLQKAPAFPIYRPSPIASANAVSRVQPSALIGDDLTKLGASMDELGLWGDSLENFDDLLESMDVNGYLPHTPRQFLSNHLLMCRPLGIKYDCVGHIVDLPKRIQAHDLKLSLDSQLHQAKQLNSEYEHIVLQYDRARTFEFVGLNVESVSKATSSYAIRIDCYKSFDGVVVLALHQEGKYTKIFFDAGNNASAYWNFLFTSPDMHGDYEFARVAVLRFLQADAWDFPKAPKTFLNKGIEGLGELINCFAQVMQKTKGKTPLRLFNFQYGNLEQFFYGKIITKHIDTDFLAVYQPKTLTDRKQARELSHTYVDQTIYEIPESDFAVVSHLYARTTTPFVWIEDISVVHTDNTMEILKAIRDKDIYDEFMGYLNHNQQEATHVVQSDNEQDLEFRGKLLGFVSNRKAPDLNPESKDKNARWTELALYQTKGGSFVCHQAKYSIVVNEHTLNTAKVCADRKGVTDFFGFNHLAKSLYDIAGFNANKLID